MSVARESRPRLNTSIGNHEIQILPRGKSRTVVSSFTMLVACVYLPCDNNFSNDEYDAALAEVFTSDVCQEVDYIIVGGDFNTDLSRLSSPHTIALEELCNRENMLCVKRHVSCDIDYTFESKANHSRSCIDHFIVSENLNDLILKCETMHAGDNLSDHDPVLLKLSIDAPQFMERAPDQFVSKPLWSKASENQRAYYQYLLDIELMNIDMSHGLFNCTDFCCTDQSCLEQIDRYHEMIINACIQASTCIPWSTPNRRQRPVLGWNEFVRVHREQAMSTHISWKAAGSPLHGPLFERRKESRKAYHAALNYVKRHEDRIRAEKMAANLTGSGF